MAAKPFNKFLIAGFFCGTVLSIWLIAGGGLLKLLGLGSREVPPVELQERSVVVATDGTKLQQSLEQSRVMDRNREDPVDAKALPFIEDFSDEHKVREGELPPGWDGDALIGIHRLGPQSWLQTSGRNYAQVATPMIDFPERFHLEVVVHNATPFSVSFVNPSGETTGVSFGVGSTYAWRTQFELNGKQYDTTAGRIHYWPLRIRLVCEGKMFRLIVRDKVVATVVASSPDVSQLVFRLGGSSFAPGPCRIGALMITDLTDTVQEQPITSFFEDFSTTQLGELPLGWYGSANVVVQHVNGDRVLGSTKVRECPMVYTPSMRLPDDFILEMVWATREGSSHYSNLGFRVILEGDRNSPDLIAGYSGRDLTLTGASAVHMERSRNQRNHVLRLIRYGTTYHLEYGGKKYFAHRLPDHVDFRGMAIVFYDVGVSTTARVAVLKSLELTSSSAGPVARHDEDDGIDANGDDVVPSLNDITVD